MTRIKGDIKTALRFEVLASGPLDARLKVDTFNDLLNPDTWKAVDGNIYLDSSLIIRVSGDSSTKNGFYHLINDGADHTKPESWIKFGACDGGGGSGGGDLSASDLRTVDANPLVKGSGLPDNIDIYSDIWQPLSMASNLFRIHRNKNTSYYFELNSNTIISEDTNTIPNEASSQCTVLYRNMSDVDITVTVPNNEKYICLTPNPVTLKPKQHLLAIFKGDGLRRHVYLHVQDESQIITDEIVFTIDNNSISADSTGGDYSGVVTSTVDSVFRDFSVQSKPSWLDIVIPPSPTGSTKTIGIAINNNTGTARSGNIVLVQSGTDEVLTISVSQSASEAVFTANKNVLEYAANNGKGFNIVDANTLVITSSVDGEYRGFTTSAKPDWVTMSGSGIVNNQVTYSLTISPNANDDSREGVISFTQNLTGEILIIQIIQKGLLENGIPTIYPYVVTEDTIDRYYQVYALTDAEATFRDEVIPYKFAQMGRQRWCQHDMRVAQNWIDGTDIFRNPMWGMREAQYNTWLGKYEYARPFDIGVFNDQLTGRFTAGLWYQNLVEIPEFNRWQSGVLRDNDYGDTGSTKHHIPYYVELKEMLAFVLTYFWDGETQLASEYIESITRGKTIMKAALNSATDAYDDDREVYSNVFDRDLIHVGTDDFAVGFASNGMIHQSNDTDEANNMGRTLIAITLALSDYVNMDPNDEDRHNVANRYHHRTMVYGGSLLPNVTDPTTKRWGWNGGSDATGFIGKTFRCMRYVELPFKIYTDNTNNIVRVNNGATPPSGYTEVPYGPLAGAFIAKPTFSYEQCKTIANFIEAYCGDLTAQSDQKIKYIG